MSENGTATLPGITIKGETTPWFSIVSISIYKAFDIDFEASYQLQL